MIDKKRLYLMIRLAGFEEKHRDGAFRINRYTQKDYIAFALIRNFLLSTIAYMLLLGIVAMSNLDWALALLNRLDLRQLVAVLLVFYLIFLGIYSVISYVLAKLRYVRMQHLMASYKEGLHRLRRMYQGIDDRDLDDRDLDEEGELE